MAYSTRNQGETGINLPLICLQCGGTVGPPPYLSLEVKDEHGAVMGYLHPIGDCREMWQKAHPLSGGGASK